MKKLILIGAGGHSKSVVDSIEKLQYKLCGFIDENKKGVHLGLPIFGTQIEDIPNYKEFSYFVSIGDVGYRKMWFDKIIDKGLNVINIIDSSAIISSSARIGIGNFVGKMAVINADAEIGNNNIINTKALIEHECKVGDHNHLSTNSVINGNVIVEDSIFMGSSSVCNGQLKIGHGSVIGSGSVIIEDVPEMVTVVGVPARVIKRRD
ncbi:MAG: NeuD/PglB/VioB family sugar acetyltransferase [Clostridiales bacterium]|nr:NeuD/PglB/VioB family sugar acetyltransferase [Clostridiales bacterium]